MGLKGGSSKQYVTDYRATLHIGVAVGRVDTVRSITIGDKKIAIPVQTENGQYDIIEPGLFGGPKKGGGALGRAWFLFGDSDQTLPEELAAKHGRTSATMTGYRGFLSIFFTGIDNTLGFLWGANNPVIPAMSVECSCAPIGPEPGNANAMIGPDANPAYIIYECLRDREFGVGYPEWQVEADTFIEAAQVLFTEGLGLSFLWMEQTEVDRFVNEVLNHISGKLNFNLVTGKWELSLLRGNYDAKKLREINPSNARLKNFQRKSWGETINEMVVTWTNPANEEEETVTAHDDGNMSVQSQSGSPTSDSRGYPGIRNQQLALRVAERDLRQASAPLASIEVEVDRSLWNVKAGDVLNFYWPDRDIKKPIVVRVLDTDHGVRGAPSVSLKMIEDIFSFGAMPVEAADPEQVIIDQEPIDVPSGMIETAPYYMLALSYGDASAEALVYPAVRAMLFAHSGLVDIREIDVLAEVTDSLGGLAYAARATIDEAGLFILTEPIPAQTVTTLVVPPSYDRRNLAIGSFFVFVDPTTQELQEIALVTNIFGSSVTLARGMLDTVPQEWTLGTMAWVISVNTRTLDETDRAAAESPNYKLLPITSLGRLEAGDATVRTHPLTERPHLPNRPANLKLNGAPIPGAVAPTNADMAVTWSNRNRLTETSILLMWSDGDVTPEDGQTTTIRVYDGATLVTTIAGVVGASRDLTLAELGDPEHFDTRRIELSSVRDGLESLQRSAMTVAFFGENLLTYSHDFSQWSTLAGQVAGATDGPVSGVAGASKLTSRSASFTLHYKIAAFSMVAGQEYTVSAVLKAAEVTGARIYVTGVGQTTTGRTFNLATGVDTPFSVGAITASSMTPIPGSGGGWYLCQFSFIAMVSVSASCLIRLGTADFTGNSVNGIYADHAQIERGRPFSGYYIRKP